MCITPYYRKVKGAGGESLNKKHNVLKVVEAMARKKVESDSFRWPPLCTGILHQPKRPVQRKNKQ